MDKEFDIDRVIWALRYDSAFLTREDRAWISDMLEHNKHNHLPKGSWLYFWVERCKELEEA